jgi:uncharacterized protein YjbI with pentapeptide repeats
VISGRLQAGWVNVAGHLVGPSANLTTDDFTGAHFGGALMRSAKLTGSNVTGANLTRAHLGRTRTGHLIVFGGKLPRLPRLWLYQRGYLLGPGADLTGAPLQNEKLPTINLSRAMLDRTDLQNANLSHANLTRASLTYVNLQHANLSHAALGGVVSSHLIGHPVALPAGWAIVAGVLVHR